MNIRTTINRLLNEPSGPEDSTYTQYKQILSTCVKIFGNLGILKVTLLGISLYKFLGRKSANTRTLG